MTQPNPAVSRAPEARFARPRIYSDQEQIAALREGEFSRMVLELVAKHGLKDELLAEASDLLLRAGVPEARVSDSAESLGRVLDIWGNHDV